MNFDVRKTFKQPEKRFLKIFYSKKIFNFDLAFKKGLNCFTKKKPFKNASSKYKTKLCASTPLKTYF